MSKSNSPRPNTNAPLGMKAAPGPAASKAVVKVTDNTDGWAAVANIPVPPAAESRSFKRPLGLGPVLVNGGVVPTAATPDEEPKEKPKVEQPAKSLGGNSTPQGLSFTPQAKETPKPAKMTTVELDWYGAKLSLSCLNAIYQPANTGRGNQSWLMLEMPLDEKTGNPPWIPPIAELQEDGRISVPEFKCKVDGIALRCQILNIELFDEASKKYVVVFRIVE